MADVQKSLEKIGLVLDKLVEKVDELDKRVAKLEERNTNISQNTKKERSVSSSNTFSGAASSFLGALGGVVAGMGLYHLLFDDDIEPKDFANSLGVDHTKIDIENIGEKVDELDEELERLIAQVDEFEDGINDDEFEQMSLDDYLASEEDFDDFDEV